jgi:hypothetical protein
VRAAAVSAAVDLDSVAPEAVKRRSPKEEEETCLTAGSVCGAHRVI